MDLEEQFIQVIVGSLMVNSKMEIYMDINDVLIKEVTVMKKNV